jgi:dTDP-glucose 4,6-dehydratase
MHLLITGGAGFIGSNFVHLMAERRPEYRLTILDALTYSGNYENISSCVKGNIAFHEGDVRDASLAASLMKGVDAVIHFAAESHVDRSLYHGGDFISTNVQGTYTLLRAARDTGVSRFIQIGTDEVYGSVRTGSSKETDPLFPSSPYSASKAGADCMAHAFHVTFGLPVIITRSSNNFGPFQYPEKLIPFFISNALEDKPLPLYGDGMNVRDWIYVQDNCEAIDRVLHKGKPGEIYNIGGGNEHPNIEITHAILDILGKPRDLITFVKDRPGHDRRYSLDCTKMAREMGWTPRFSFKEAMMETVEWYVRNRPWWEAIKSRQAAFRDFERHHYSQLKEGSS